MNRAATGATHARKVQVDGLLDQIAGMRPDERQLVTKRLEKLHMAALDREHIAQRITQARLEAGLTQPEMAKALDIGMRTYQNYESDKKPRTPWGLMNEIAEITGKSTAWLIHGEEATPDLFAQVSKVEQVEDVRAQFLKLVEEHNSKLDRQNRTLERMERNQWLIMRALEVRAPESDAPPIVPYPEAELPPGADRRGGQADRRAHGAPARTGSEG
jgi:transcriptional regulator with XRE-family HTH domain